MKMKNKLSGTLSLLLATMIWGSAFIAQSVGMDHVGPFTFQAARCFLAVLVLIPTAFFFDKGKNDGKTFTQRWFDKKLLKAGLFCGIPLFLAANLQQMGLLYTTPGKAGFLTAMYIVIVPIMGIFLKRKPSVLIPVSVLMAVGGLYLLCCAGETGITIGDWLLLGCAFMFSVQITVVDSVAADVDGIRLNCLQSLVCAALSAIVMFFGEKPTLDGIWLAKVPIAYAGVLSMGLAYTLQILGQKKLEASVASLLMSLESVFAVLTGWLVLHQTLSRNEAWGCVLVFAAVILAQIPVEFKKSDG